MIHLRTMTEPEYVRFRILDRQNYTESIIRAYGMSRDEAQREALTLGEDILKQGMGTPGHEFFTAVEEASGRAVGYLWCEVNREKRRAFLYFVVVEETERGRGLGEAALRQLEGRLKADGIKSLGLHVFSHNTGALRLYERLGFQVTSVNMQKSL